MINIKNKIKNNKKLFIFLKNIQIFFKYLPISFLQLIFYLFPIDSKKIVVSNYYGRGYGDNAKPIIDELLKTDKNYNIIWLLSDMSVALPRSVKKVKYGSLTALYHLCTAKVWLDNCRKEKIFLKRKRQFYIQLWHGSLPLKKIEKDTEETLPYEYVIRSKRDSKMTDLMISNSKFTTNLYRNAFWYNGKVIECGVPRNDILINNANDINIICKVKKYFKLNKNQKILLYAPTFRKDFNLDNYLIDCNRILNVLKRKFNSDWKILIRLHPNIPQFAVNNLFNNKLYSKSINATNYPDMQELMIASDILVTDYSSTIFEFSIMKKPVFIFATDIADYNNDRGFYFDLYKLPFNVCEDNSKLISCIEKFKYGEYNKQVDIFFKEIGLIENGNSSKCVAEIISKM